jgi:hypothetical protein
VTFGKSPVAVAVANEEIERPTVGDAKDYAAG